MRYLLLLAVLVWNQSIDRHEGWAWWFDQAALMSGYPPAYPKLVFLPAHRLADVYCGPGHRADPSCRVDGVYIDGRPVIYVNSSAGYDVIGETILHEVTHYAQALKGYRHRCANEFEASRVEWAYRNVYVGWMDAPDFDWRWYGCPAQVPGHYRYPE